MIYIVTAHRNAEDFERTFKSVVSQTMRDFLWVIVDDSSDVTCYRRLINVCAQDSRVVVIKNIGPQFAGNARNFGIEYISGLGLSFPLLLTFIDADDVWHERFLSETLLVFDTFPNVDMVCFGYNLVWREGYVSSYRFRGSLSLFRVSFDYPFACLTTTVRLRSTADFRHVFGSGRQINDQPFFVSFFMDHLDSTLVSPKVLADYHVGNSSSVSGNKFKVFFHRYRLYRSIYMFSVLRSIASLFAAAVFGMRKYRGWVSSLGTRHRSGL